MKYTKQINEDSFYNKKKIGDKGEYIVTKLLQDKGYDVINVADKPEWQKADVDLLIYKNNKLIHKIEVKTEKAGTVTGNFFVETKSNSKQGWIFYTEADYLYVVIPNVKVYVIFVDEFKAWFKNVMYDCKIKKAATTGKNGEVLYNNYGRLIPLTVLDELEFIYSIPLN
jgi:Holliday junction resolvase-like predicted endonuclease